MAKGTKLNIPMLPGMGDKDFFEEWEAVVRHVSAFKPEFILFQCGADSLAGDPLAMLQYTPAAHAHAAKSLCGLANEFTGGRIMGFGGGGYNRGNLAAAWCAVLDEFTRASAVASIFSPSEFMVRRGVRGEREGSDGLPEGALSPPLQ